MMGANEFLDLLSSSAVAYLELSKEEESENAANSGGLLNFWLFELFTFYQSLWLIKDNAVTNELAFCFFTHPVKRQLVCTSNFLRSRPTTANGKTLSAKLSLSELRTAREYFLQLIPMTFYEAAREMVHEGSAPAAAMPFRQFKGTPRLPRLNYFLSGARSFEDMPIKIALYMTCFEILFSTTASELTHKLSERVAFFLGQNAAERKAIFNTVKAAYAFRSKIIHGDEVEINEKLTCTVVEIDGLLRRIFLKILQESETQTIFEKNKQDLEEYLTNLTLGVKPEDSSTG